MVCLLIFLVYFISPWHMVYAESQTGITGGQIGSLGSAGGAADGESNMNRRTNILMILADDLGYGDTSVYPFVGNGVATPNLEAMAARGTVMTNFHTAATVCTPTRASILTGMYPWRLGIKAVYEYGKKGESNRDDWLPQVPTVATAFKGANYSTSHSGKWHLGGMRNDDLDMRTLKQSDPLGATKGGKRCPHPGPNQQGFEEYVSVLDGPGAPRQNSLQVSSTLYSRGCEHLIKNDQHIGRAGGGDRDTLSDCEARHAIRQMRESVDKGKPFYQQVWFHAPHGPWEYIHSEESNKHYPQTASTMAPDGLLPCSSKDKSPRFCVGSTSQGGKPKVFDRGPQKIDKYRTMITDMDKAIGKLLAAIKEMGVERNTLVVFTSDNGPEEDAGCVPLWRVPDHPWKDWNNWKSLWTTVGLRGNKRFIYEGGLKVPTIIQWVGTVPRGRNCSTFAVTTDLYPTFLEAAGLEPPPNVRLDGMSFLSEILPSEKLAASQTSVTDAGGGSHAPSLPSSFVGTGTQRSLDFVDNAHRRPTKATKRQKKKMLSERVTLWHNDFEGPRATAARLMDFKLILGEKEEPFEMFDLRHDPHESNNLVKLWGANQMRIVQAQAGADSNRVANPKPTEFTPFNIASNANGVRQDPALHHWIFAKLYRVMVDFALRGNAPHILYMRDNPGRTYNATVESDIRSLANPYKKVPRALAKNQHQERIHESSCSTPCSCETPSASMLQAYPVDRVGAKLQYVMPKHPFGFINGSAALLGS